MSEKKKKGKIVIICAPSGTGKSTLIKKLLIRFPQLVESVSTTTRPKREGELEGFDYFFISESDFLKDKEKLVEWAKVHDNYYGTGKKFIEDNLKQGKFILCDVDVQGCDNFKKLYPEDSMVIFLSPPSLEVLENRLRKRGTESEKSLKTRMANAKIEMERKDDFDFNIVNDDLERAFKELESVFESILKGNS